MIFGEPCEVFETDDKGVKVIHSYTRLNDLHSGESRVYVPYEEILGVKYLEDNSLGFSKIGLILDVKGKSYPMNVVDENPYRAIAYVLRQKDKAREDAKKMKAYIEKKVADIRRQSEDRVKNDRVVCVQKSSNTLHSNSKAHIGELLKLKELLDEGLISKEEFMLMKLQMYSNCENEQDVVQNSVESNNVQSSIPVGGVMKQQFLGKRLTREDFMIFDGSEQWNFISRYSSLENAWYEFCENDILYSTARGLNVASSKKDVLEAYDIIKPIINETYDYRVDRIYILSHRDNTYSETDLLRSCKETIKYSMIEGGFKFSITYYFDYNGSLLLVGYLKEKNNEF